MTEPSQIQVELLTKGDVRKAIENELSLLKDHVRSVHGTVGERKNPLLFAEESAVIMYLTWKLSLPKS